MEAADKAACLGAGGRWVNPPFGNFDDVFSAMLMLFEMSGMEGWPDVMYQGVDAKAEDVAPQEDFNVGASLYFILWICVGALRPPARPPCARTLAPVPCPAGCPPTTPPPPSPPVGPHPPPVGPGALFLLNLFVGVIVDTFTQLHREHEEEAKRQGMTGGKVDTSVFVAQGQQEWLDTLDEMMKIKPVRAALSCTQHVPSSHVLHRASPSQSPLRLLPVVVSSAHPTVRQLRRPPRPAEPGLRRTCYDTVKWKHFEMAVLCVILFNTLLMGVDAYGIPPWFSQVLYVLNLGCAAVFCVEATLKITAWTFSEYIRDAWNIFDFTVVMLSLLDVTVTLLAANLPINPTMLRVVRVIRVVRILRSVKSAKGLRSLMTTLLFSLPALSNICFLFVLVLFLFSVLGMQLFGHVKHGEFLNDDANFCTFPVAFITMFRCSTGESWNGLMHDCMVTPEDAFNPCSEEAGDCGSAWAAIPFFLGFTVLAAFMILNMMIAVILDEFSASLKRDARNLKPDHAESFQEAWAQFDPWATEYINAADMLLLVRLLPAPMGLGDTEEEKGAPGSASKRKSRANYDRAAADKVRELNLPTYVLPGKDASPKVSFGDVLRQMADEGSVNKEGMSKEVADERAKLQAHLLERQQEEMAQQNPGYSVGHDFGDDQIAAAGSVQRNIGHDGKVGEALLMVPAEWKSRCEHSMTIYKGRTFVFGGRSADGPMRDFWSFSNDRGEWVDHSASVPEDIRARHGHDAVLCDDRLIILGGFDGARTHRPRRTLPCARAPARPRPTSSHASARPRCQARTSYAMLCYAML